MGRTDQRRRRRARLERAREAEDTTNGTPAPGERSYQNLRATLESSVRSQLAPTDSDQFGCWVSDFGTDWVVYELSGTGPTSGQFRVSYTIDDGGKVTFGTPDKVEEHTTWEEVTEARDHIEGRVLEARGTSEVGGRIFRVEILRYGESRNGRVYPGNVMRRAVRLYEGAKAYDHHRTDDELKSSTTAGLVGSYRNVDATERALEADLYVLPSAVHTTEALDASIEAQDTGLPPLVGISHDVMGKYRPVGAGGGRRSEATEIVSVNSADIVADPAAGGRATRMVAGGAGDTEPQEGTTMNLKQLLALLRDEADAAKRAELLKEHSSVLDESGLTDDDVTKMLAEPETPAPGGDGDAGDGGNTGGGDAGNGNGSGEQVPAAVGAGTEAAAYERSSFMGRRLIRDAMDESKLDDRLLETVTDQLGERFTEADLGNVVKQAQTMTSAFERRGLRPSVPHAEVGEEDLDKKKARLDAMLAGNFREGYHSLKTAFRDITQSDFFSLDDADLPFTILRESFQTHQYEGMRQTESVDTTSWGEILGDSITRRMVAEYGQADLGVWRKLVSSIVPRNDFREVKVTRMGGFGTLPTVLQGGVYQPLTSPTDEQAVYTPTKKGGTEDLTLEAVANDDLGAVQRIPKRLGRAAAQTLYRFVFDLLASNPTIYDAVALFAAGHSNTDAGAALAQATLSTGRRKMRKQTAYGDTSETLGEVAVPKLLVVPPDIEEIAFQLATSAVAIPATPAGPTDTPNIHQGLEPIVADYFSDTNDWFLVADPTQIPTIELGFYGGREDPELFVQDDPRVGAVFNADKITWKIRHIYSGAVLDFRGFYRGQG